MGKVLVRWFGVILFVLGGPLWADIPMVVTPIKSPSVRILPSLPQLQSQKFNGVTEVSVLSGEDNPQLVDISSQVDVSAFGTSCDVDISVAPRKSAMIELKVFAPCKPHAAVHVSHGGLSYEARVSLTGRSSLRFPAMQRDAEVFVAVEEDVFERRIVVDDVKFFARVALVGTGEDAPELIASGFSGQMAVYQNQGVQVFSVDQRGVEASMTYRLTLRHLVTAKNCDQPVHSHLRRILPGMGEERQVLTLAAQDCNRIGSILELKNVVQDLKLASN
jgi:hypothetical protein